MWATMRSDTYIAYRLVMESRAAQQEAIEKLKGGTK